MNLVPALEAVLFVAEAPMTPEDLATALGATRAEVLDALERLGDRMEDTGGLQIVRLAGGFQIATKPEHAEHVARASKPTARRFSRSVMEVLAVVAYRQPVTLAEIEAIRGVQSDYGVRQLVERRLVREAGRKQAPGRPMLYATTRQFLHEFNLDSLAGLPPIDGESGDPLQGILTLA